MKVSTTSGAMNSAEPTGVKRTGVLVGVAGLTTMLLRSKSHILTGITWRRERGREKGGRGGGKEGERGREKGGERGREREREEMTVHSCSSRLPPPVPDLYRCRARSVA